MTFSKIAFVMLLSSWFLTGCGTERQKSFAISDEASAASGTNATTGNATANVASAPYNRKSRIADVMAGPVFGNYGRLLFR